MMKLKTLTVAILMVLGVGIAMANTVIPPNPKKDPKQAFNYVYNIVVTQNTSDPWAEYLLAKYYKTGSGTQKNIGKAYVWYRMSSIHNYKPALQSLAKLKKSMSAEQIKKGEKQYVITRDNSVKRILADIKYATTH